MTATERTLIVILGATGDLTARKLLPALYHLVRQRGLDAVILGAATSDLDDETFRARAREALSDAGYADAAEWCDGHVHYQQIERDGGYDDLGTRADSLEAEHGLPGNRVFYLALPPRVFPSTIERLGDAGLNRSRGWTRLVIEKPFGRDLESARELNAVTHRHFTEDQVYRIDHYLGKETVQNLLVFRFSNPIFEASWNRDRIDRVEITVAEALGVGTRGRYYDHAGAIRDMLQSHLAQVLTLVALETPVALHADFVRAEKVKVLRSITAIDPHDVTLGQYTAGTVDGEPLPGYRETESVDPASTTPTYAAVKVWIDNWRWQGVPFYLRTGKAMNRRTTQIAVTFRRPPVCFFHGVADDCIAHSDVLYLTLQPDEGFTLEIEVKEPGDTTRLRTVPLGFSYGQAFGAIPDAYETLLHDVVEGDQTLFVRADEVEQSWRLFAPLLDAELPMYEYPAGSWGPTQARDLLGDVANWATGS